MNILIENIRKHYPRAEKPALDVDELQLTSGNIHGILGHSGSGKSTLLNLLALLDLPDPVSKAAMRFTPGGGNASYEWKPDRTGIQWMHTRHRDKWRQLHYSFVFQSGYLLAHFPVLHNVLMPLRLRGRVTKEKQSEAMTLLERIGIAPEKWSLLPHQLSGGEYQRVAVARSIIHSPSVIFADEPTGSLDPHWGAETLKVLKSWCKDKNPAGQDRLLLLVTHNVDHAVNYCDAVTVLCDGKKTLDRKKGSYSAQDILNAMATAQQTILSPL